MVSETPSDTAPLKKWTNKQGSSSQPSTSSVATIEASVSLPSTELQQTAAHTASPTKPKLPPSIKVVYAVTFLFVLSTAMVGLAPAQALVRWMSSPETATDGAGRATTILSVITAVSALLEITTSNLFGSVLDLSGRKPMLTLTVAALTLTHVLMAIHPGVVTVCIAKFVGMVAFGFFALTTQTIISDIATQSASAATTRDTAGSGGKSNHNGAAGLVSSAMGVQMAIMGGGFLLGMICAGQLSEFGLVAVYGVSAFVGALAVLLIQLGLPETLLLPPVVEMLVPQTGPSSPPMARKNRRSLLETLTSSTRLLTRHGKDVRVLGILLMLMMFPMFMGDFFQIFAKSEWSLSPKQLSSFFALYAGIGIVSNTVGSFLVRRIGIKKFTGIALVSRMMTQIGTIFFGYQGCLIGMFLGFLGQAQSIGIVAALVSAGARTGLPQGEMAGERASLMALLKVVGPITYSTLYIQGQRLLGSKRLPFIFNIGLFAVALIISQMHL